jgi:stage IV sporulation protein FB
MKTDYELFRVNGIPVSISLWFLLLLPMTGFSLTIFASVFVAVLIHELGHALTAQHLGYGSYGISIGLFAGQAQVDSNIHPRDNMKVVAAGPLSNLLLVIIGSILGLDTFVEINMFLFLFNILPIYPMDGGHLFKDFLMLNMRNRRKAFEISMMVSLVTSVFLLIFSFLSGQLIIGILSIVFGYLALKELGYIK